uniref:Uncharacterized protein n=1 Tax=Anguilla anguilla TaxID=7936 RepID=A0A0E9WQD3_ANGAN
MLENFSSFPHLVVIKRRVSRIHTSAALI